MGLRESDRLLVELKNLSSANLRLVEHGGSDDLDGVMAGRVSSAHLHVHLGNGTAKGSVSVFLVHVDGDGSSEVSEENTVVLDRGSVLLEDLAGGHNLSLNLSDLVLSLHVVPELGSGEDGVGGEHTHSEEFGIRVLLSGVSSSHNEELSDLYRIAKLASNPENLSAVLSTSA